MKPETLILAAFMLIVAFYLAFLVEKNRKAIKNTKTFIGIEGLNKAELEKEYLKNKPTGAGTPNWA